MLIKRKSIEAEGNHRSGPRLLPLLTLRKPKFVPITYLLNTMVFAICILVQNGFKVQCGYAKPDWPELSMHSR